MHRFENYLRERIEKRALEQGDGYLFIPYHAPGDPDIETSHHIVDTLFEAGADAVEIGLPFTDPVADGPVLQRTFRRILETPFSFDATLEFINEAHSRHPDRALVVMGYANLFYRRGFRKTLRDLYKNGVSGVIIPDIPLEEKIRLVDHEKLGKELKNIAWIDFITPSVTEERLRKTAETAQGFIYVVSYKGVTGQAGFTLEPLKPLFKSLREATGVPLVTGFGIRTRAHAQEAVSYSDGFIIASQLHSIIEENLNNRKEIVKLIKKEVNSVLP